ncbi:M17 family metallopeptidase [Rugosimonospora acidiphila]|uniref:Probable cytosol aminopeptidase n=1 Tax=Rugosimonospora acidiphila TaxID=556531 RepID=A0ABP9RHP2_9ACTN
MLTIRLSAATGASAALALPVDPDGLVAVGVPLGDAIVAQATALVDDTDHSGAAGVVHVLPRPGERTHRLLLVGVGSANEAGWRSAGAALYRAASRESSLTIALPPAAEPSAVRGLAEGLLLAGYRFRLGAEKPGGGPTLRRVTVAVDAPERFEAALATANAVASVTYLARDLTNMPSQDKSPAWFAARVAREADRLPGLKLRVREPQELAAEGFGGILAVGGGSSRGPRLVELGWRPRGARQHVVLVGKGITFDSGGISIKTRDGMKLMRKDMGGAAAIIAATLGAAALKLPVRVTALAPLAENMVSGSAYRPGDVVRHYGGRTTEVLNTDAEGRVVLADALAYAARRLNPDLLVDLATLTGANAVALGKRTAALYSDNDELAGALSAAAGAAGEKVWRLPLPDDYLELLASDIADAANVGDGGAGSVTAALFLREFAGAARNRWAHLDMSAPSWIEGPEGELVKGATGWGVRTLLRWLEGIAAENGQA